MTNTNRSRSIQRTINQLYVVWNSTLMHHELTNANFKCATILTSHLMVHSAKLQVPSIPASIFKEIWIRTRKQRWYHKLMFHVQIFGGGNKKMILCHLIATHRSCSGFRWQKCIMFQAWKSKISNLEVGKAWLAHDDKTMIKQKTAAKMNSPQYQHQITKI